MRWVTSLARRVTWLHVTRTIGLAALIYEVIGDAADRPSLMIVVGAMILGTEGLALGRKKHDES